MSADFNMDNVLEQLGHKRRTVKRFGAVFGE